MSAPFPGAGELIHARRGELAQAIVQRQYDEDPEMAGLRGEVGRARCLEDANYHLLYLSQAISAGEPKLFIDYLNWASVTLASRGIPAKHLTRHLELMVAILRDKLGHE